MWRSCIGGGYPVIRSSDSHCLNMLGTAHTDLEIGSLSVDAVRSGLQHT
ncbi:hypothetical protein EGM51_02740 [Verrucomicrobia bacterium S94]|nr:hypothetical protein EGM51_02740 [Verrucomicrobia bacterium S94]